MKRSTMWMLMSVVLAGVLGWLLAANGMYVNTWMYWAVLFVFVVYGEVKQERGDNLCKEKFEQDVVNAIRAFLTEIVDEDADVSIDLELTG